MKRSLAALACAVVAVVLIVGIVWFVRASDAADAADARAQTAAMRSANSICGRAPQSIRLHGSSWSWGPWIEVTCQDGTKRAVYRK